MEVAKQSARGSAILFGGNLLATVLAAAASIVVARLLGPSLFGLFTLSLVMPSLLQLLTHFGTRTAVTRYVAHHLTLGEVEKARRFAQSAMIFSLVSGFLLAVVNYFASSWAATVLFQRPELAPYIALSSYYLIGQSLVLNVIAIATGWYAMGQAAFVNILQSGLKLVISPALILLGFGVSGAVLGHAFSFVIGGAVSAAVLFFTKVKFVRERLEYFAEDTKEMLKFGFEPFVGNLLAGLATFYVSLLLAIVTVGHNELVGYYMASLNLTIPLSLLSSATATALYPAFTRLHGIKADTKQAFALALKFVAFLIGPVVFFLMAASVELISAFYGSSFTAGSSYLFLLALASAPVVLGQGIFGGFFLGLGHPRLNFITAGIGAIVLFAFAPFLAVFAGWGVDGLIVALLVSNGTAAVAGMYLLHRYELGVADWGSLLGSVGASLVALAACLVLPTFADVVIMLIVKIALFAGIYLTLSPLLGAVSIEDLDILRESLRGVPVVGKLVSPFIGYMRAMLRLKR